MHLRSLILCLGAALAHAPYAVAAQVPLDRADPAIQQQSLPVPAQAPLSAPTPSVAADRLASAPALQNGPITADRIAVTGNQAIETTEFAAAIEPFLRRPLDEQALRSLAGAVGDVARSRDYVLATAAVQLSPGTGTVTVRLDEGRIDAVRLLGIRNAAVERILQNLVTGRPVTGADLERAILLAGDVAGVRIRSNRYVREAGFGLLLVEAGETRASFYGQVENRGSKEIGPIRSTVLASLRGALQAGDELTLIAANTPLQPREFVFVRPRYTMPVGGAGAAMSVAASYGRTHPGASLQRLDVIGHSYDASVAVQLPLVRRKAGSLWANIELRGASSDQSLSAVAIREDRIATLTASLLAERFWLGGEAAAAIDLAWGLPLGGTTREGDRLASRPDGSARFALAHGSIEWVRRLSDVFSLRLAGEGQVASRPLLAAIELGAGGPAFARAYDYAERTGDQGLLGSGELRADLPVDWSGPFRRIQAYGFIDGGYVDNLERGFGGGSLASAGGGARLGLERFDLALELAAPLNADRLDTGNRSIRATFRLAAHF